MRALTTAVSAAVVCGALAFAATPSDTLVLAVQGRVNETPSISAQGRLVVVAWSARMEGSVTDIYVASSRDGGVTFSTPVRVNDPASTASVSGEQPPRIALVARPGADPAIAIVWTSKGRSGTRIMTARSEDGGRSFGLPRAVAGTDAVGNRGWESVVVSRDGRVQVLWLDHRELAAGGGSSMPMHHEMHDAAAPVADGAEKAQASKLYFADADGTAARPLASGVCYCCKTGIAAGPDGSLYAVWRHVYPGNIRDIAFTFSRDGGKTFSAPTRVSEDKWAIDGCPENGPAIAVRGQEAHVIWPTLVSAPQGADSAPALFYTVTRDGRTFAPRQKIPTEGVPRHPQVAIEANGALVAAWDEAANGARHVVVARTGNGAAGRPQFARQTLQDEATAQYPSVASTDRGAVVAWTSGAAARSVIRVARIGS